MIQTNYLLDNGALVVGEDGRFSPVSEVFDRVFTELAREILMSQALGSYDMAAELVEVLGDGVDVGDEVGRPLGSGRVPVADPSRVERAGALDRLEAFASFHGPDFYGLPRNEGTVTLVEEAWKVPGSYRFDRSEVVPLLNGSALGWRMEGRSG